jgi:hypothetical protein
LKALELETPTEGSEAMKPNTQSHRGQSSGFFCVIGRAIALALLLSLLVGPQAARAGKLSWLDDVVRDVMAETKAAGKGLARGNETVRAEARSTARLFASQTANEGLERLLKQSEDFSRAGRGIDRPAEALLESRFSRLLGSDPQAVRTFSSLGQAEKRLVVEMGETAQQLVRRYPRDAEAMVRQLGPEGLSAVRVFGDDVAPVLAKEGAESLGVLRKTGRAGWSFFTDQVLPHKKKLAAAGVLSLFLADPEKFVDYAGRATEFAVTQFGKAGIQLASAVSGGALRGLDASIGSALAAYGIDMPLLRYLGMALAAAVVLLSALVLVGLPVRWAFRPLAWAMRPVRFLFRVAAGPRTLSQSPRL